MHIHELLSSFMRGCAFQLRSLAHTSFFIQNAALTPVAFALMKIVAYAATGERYGLNSSSLWVDAAIAGLWAATTTAVGIIGYQRFLGTLQYLALSVLPPSVVFLPIVASAALLGIIGVPLALVTVALCLHGVVAVSALQILGYVLALIACVASAAFLSGIFVLFSRATAYEPLILIPVWMLCGIVTPTDVMPLPVQIVAFIHPLTSAVWVAHSSQPSFMVFIASAGSIVLSLILLALSGRMLHFALRQATKEGRLNIL